MVPSVTSRGKKYKKMPQTLFKEVELMQLTAFYDSRGFFSEIYRKEWQEKPAVQTNHSFSEKGVIRGMHFQSHPGQAKYVTVITGAIYDVFVDIRPDSPTFGQWGAYELHAHNPQLLCIPVGFAHGFAALKPSHVLYQVSSSYDPITEKGFRYDDPTVKIEWPLSSPIVSDRDRLSPLFYEAFS